MMESRVVPYEEDRRTGHLVVPALRKTFYGITHQFATGESTGALAASQVGLSDTVVMDGSEEFIAEARTAVWSPATADQVKVMVRVNRALLWDTPNYLATFGTGRYPFSLPSPLALKGGVDFSLVLDDRQTVAAAVTARFLHFGWHVHEQPIQEARAYATAEPWRYTADFTVEGPNGAAVVANGVTSLPVVIDPDSDFLVYKLLLISDGEFKIQIKHSSRHRDWFNKAVHNLLLAGTYFGADPPVGAWPFRLPRSVPEFVPTRDSLFVTVQDTSAAANRIQAIFEGRKLKPPGGFTVDPSLFRRS